MKIVYVAKHNSGGNDDEGAIDHALERLGHRVEKVQESEGRKAKRLDGDFLLFHKWDDVHSLKLISIPKVFWYFDLVDYNDPTTAGRSRARCEWMWRIVPDCQLGFCTDGDWVANDQSGRLIWLPQGADERVAGVYPGTHSTDLLFTGIRSGGRQRAAFVDDMRFRYPRSFTHVERGSHGRHLAGLIAGAKIVLGPDAPVTNRYWSNRVYLTLGFGGFMLHPWCDGLGQHYKSEEEICYYSNRDDLYRRIQELLYQEEKRRAIAAAGFRRTMAQHLYRHRCERLVQIVKERLL